MTDSAPEANLRVLVLAPTGRDGPLMVRTLESGGIAAETCDDANRLCDAAEAGAGAAIVAEEALSPESLACLDRTLAAQPVWSDLPLIILTGGGKTTRFSMKIAEALQTRGNVTLLERPLRILTLLSATRAALRARARQYQMRDLLLQAQKAVRQRDQFLAMLGHELRNPLAAIRTAVEVINCGGPDRVELVREQAQIITHQSGHVSRLVDDLLDVARVTSGKVTLDRRPLDLRAIVRDALKALPMATGMDKHRIEFDASPSIVAVDGDEVRLEQIVTNLMTNALKYTPAGGRIWVKVGVEEGSAVLRVRDEGRGIPPDVMPHIFEPFVQSEQPLARSVGGLGIGLTVVRTLVQMHGGRIDVSSGGPGKGSEFVVRLPPADRLPTVVRAPLIPANLNGDDSRRVLVVEDNADARRAMQRLLKLWGHQVEVAGDGASAIRQAIDTVPEIMLVDIGLPDVDGYEVARRVRPALGAAVRLIALTGYGQPEDRQRAVDAGFDRHLVKPVEPDQLRRLLAGSVVGA